MGKGLDTIGLQDVREAVIGEDESDRGRRSPGKNQQVLPACCPVSTCAQAKDLNLRAPAGSTSPTSPNSRDTANPVFGGEVQTPVPEELRTPAAARAELSDESENSSFT